MKKKSLNLILIFLSIISGSFSFAQSNISFKLTTLTYQFTDVQSELAKLKLSSNGKLAIEPGLIFAFEGYASSNTALKIAQSFLLDKAAHLAGSTQLMIKFRVVKSFKHNLYLGIGPIFHYRQTWADMANYKDETVYQSSLDWQHKFSWLSGEIEYSYYLNKISDFTVSINHIQAESVGIAVGLKYWMSRNPRNRCVSCPSFH